MTPNYQVLVITVCLSIFIQGKIMFPGEKWLVQHMALKKVLFPKINMILGHASEMLCEPSLFVTANIKKPFAQCRDLMMVLSLLLHRGCSSVKLTSA